MVGQFLRKRKKNIAQIFPPYFFKGCRQRGKAKRDQRSMQAHKGAGGLSMDTAFFKSVEGFQRKKTKFLEESDKNFAKRLKKVK